jgi:hypothetical protein
LYAWNVSLFLTQKQISRRLRVQYALFYTMKRFFSDLVESIRSVDFYDRLAREERFSRALGHFALFVLIVSILASIPPIVQYGRMISDPEKLGTVRSVVLDTYPDELELRIDGGIASSNVEEPYLIPFPDSWNVEETGDMEALVLVDTRGPLSLDAFREYDVPIVIGQTEVGFMEEDGGIQVRRFDEFEEAGEMVINEQVIARTLDTGIPILRPIAWGLLLSLPLLFFSSLFLGYLVYLLFGALLVLVVANIRGASYSYAQSYRASLSLVRIPMLYGVLTSVWFFPEYRIPFLVSILLVVMAAGLIRKPKTESPVSQVIVDTAESSNIPKYEHTEKGMKESDTRNN